MEEILRYDNLINTGFIQDIIKCMKVIQTPNKVDLWTSIMLLSNMMNTKFYFKNIHDNKTKVNLPIVLINNGQYDIDTLNKIIHTDMFVKTVGLDNILPIPCIFEMPILIEALKGVTRDVREKLFYIYDAYHKLNYCSIYSVATEMYVRKNTAILEDMGLLQNLLMIKPNKTKCASLWNKEEDINKIKEVCVEFNNKLDQLYKDDFLLNKSVSVEIKISNDVKLMLDKYNKNRKTYIDEYRMNRTNTIDYILKVASIFALNELCLTILPRHCKKAIALIDDAILDGAMLFDDSIRDCNNSAGIKNAINKLLASPNGITHTELYNNCRKNLSTDQFTTLMTLMHELELVNIFIQSKGRRATIYQMTSNLLNDSYVNKLFTAL